MAVQPGYPCDVRCTWYSCLPAARLTSLNACGVKVKRTSIQLSGLNELNLNRAAFFSKLKLERAQYCVHRTDSFLFPLKIEAREPTRKESAKVRNRRLRKKFNGTAQKPRLSIFCSSKHLYAQLVDDSKKKTLAFASTLQESIRGSQPCDTIDAARHVGEEIIKACIEQDISQVTIDRNGFAQGQKMTAFEIPIRQHGFLS